MTPLESKEIIQAKHLLEEGKFEEVLLLLKSLITEIFIEKNINQSICSE